MNGEIAVHLSQFGFLALISLISILYAKKRFITILPGVLLGALLARLLGFEVYYPLESFSTLAAILIVFIAGLELNIDYVNKEKYRIGLQVFFEIVLLISLIIVLERLLPYELAITIVVLTLASTEAFALVATTNPELKSLGITISVMEDSFAVSVLALGYLTSKQFTPGPDIYRLVVGAFVLLVIILFLARPFNRILEYIESIDTKIIITLLFLLLLSILSEATGIPDPFTVFIGGLALAIYGYDHTTYKRMESYMYLALIGFIATLPFLVNSSLDINTFLYSMTIGLVLAFLVYILRFIILFISLYLSGFLFNHIVTISLTLANSGEFGLIVLAGLMSHNVIPPIYAYAAMFTYIFNLTLVSYITRNIDRYRDLVYKLMPKPILTRLIHWNWIINDSVSELSREGGFKLLVYQYITLALITYLSIGILKFINHPIIGTAVLLIQIASLLAAVWIGVNHLYYRLSVVRSLTTSFVIIVELFITYVFIVPILWSISTYFERYGVSSVLHPLILLSIIMVTLIIIYLVRRIPVKNIFSKDV